MKLSLFKILCAGASLLSVWTAQPACAERAADSLSNKRHAATLVELYTSQSCTRCPKANAEFAEFAQTHDVIALTFAVDYWNYMGWEDTFALPEFGARQIAINETMGRRGPYTPQVIFNAASHCSASKLKSLTNHLKNEAKPLKDMSMSFDGEKLILDVMDSQPVDVWRADYIPGQTFETPTDGYNRDKEMVYFNRVTVLERIASFSEGKGETIDRCEKSCVFIVQAADAGPVLAAISYTSSE